MRDIRFNETRGNRMDKTWKCILVIAVLLLIYLVCINQGGGSENYGQGAQNSPFTYTDTYTDTYTNNYTYTYEPAVQSCTSCHGTGTCDFCYGSGTYRAYGEAVTCAGCGGTGRCSSCGGTGSY